MVLRHSQTRGNLMPSNSQMKEDAVQRHFQTWGDMVLLLNVVLRHSQTWGDMVLRDLLMWENVVPSNSQMWSQTLGGRGAEAFPQAGKCPAEP